MTTTEDALEHLARAAMCTGAVYFAELVKSGRMNPNRPLSEAFGIEPREFLKMRRDLTEPFTLRVLDGDPGEIEAALDALPVGSIVESSAEAVADQEPRAWARESNGMSRDHVGWRGTGRMTMFGSDYLAKYCAPLVVISQ